MFCKSWAPDLENLYMSMIHCMYPLGLNSGNPQCCAGHGVIWWPEYGTILTTFLLSKQSCNNTAPFPYLDWALVGSVSPARLCLSLSVSVSHAHMGTHTPLLHLLLYLSLPNFAFSLNKTSFNLFPHHSWSRQGFWSCHSGIMPPHIF